MTTRNELIAKRNEAIRHEGFASKLYLAAYAEFKAGERSLAEMERCVNVLGIYREWIAQLDDSLEITSAAWRA